MMEVWILGIYDMISYFLKYMRYLINLMNKKYMKNRINKKYMKNLINKKYMRC